MTENNNQKLTYQRTNVRMTDEYQDEDGLIVSKSHEHQKHLLKLTLAQPDPLGMTVKVVDILLCTRCKLAYIEEQPDQPVQVQIPIMSPAGFGKRAN